MSSIKLYTFLSVLTSILLVGLYRWWFQSGMILTLIYIVFSLLLIFSIPLLYRLAGFSATDDNFITKQKEKKEHDNMLNRLHTIQKAMKQLKHQEGIRQTQILIDIIDDYYSVINTRFYGKQYQPLTYLSAARRVQKQAIQNLSDVIAIAHSLSTIQRNKRKSDALKNTIQQTRYDKQTKMLREQTIRIDNLLEKNNQLYNALMDTAVEVANMKSFNQHEQMDTLSHLIALADIAKQSSLK